MSSLAESRSDPDLLQFDLDSYRDKNYLTHNFHPYPAKFVPQIPRVLIDSLSRPGQIVLDPFCGSGTTLVEAAISGRDSIGTDINPLACLASLVKTTPLNDAQLVLASDLALDVVRSVTGLYIRQLWQSELADVQIPAIPNIDHWFEPHIQRELAVAKDVIGRSMDAQVSDFLRLALSSVIVPVSNQESETRYAAVKKHLPRGIVGKLFLKKVRDMIPRMKDFTEKRQPVSVEVYCADSTEKLPAMKDAVDLIVTSPPYPNTYDYYLYHKFRMLWLDMDYRDAQLKEFGSRNKHTDERKGIEHFAEKMGQAMRLLHGALKNGGYLCVVVGDAIVRGEYFRMNEVIIRLGDQCGFSIAKSFSYPLRRYTKAFTPGMRNTEKAGHILILKRT